MSTRPGWHVLLNDALIAGADTLPSGKTAADVMACLELPPDGLGVPGLRTEDVTYPQRDGVDMFADWYENRVLTVTATVSDDDCDSDAARVKALRLMKAWSRQCGQTEMVLWPDDTGSNPETAGPFGVVGRPRVATLQWERGTKQVGHATLRFDSVDHRLYILDPDGTPGSGAVCQTAEDTPLIYSLASLAASGMAEQYYTLVTPQSTPNNNLFDDQLFNTYLTMLNTGTSLTGWTASSTFASSTGPSLSPDGQSVRMTASDSAANTFGTMTMTLTQGIAANAAKPYVAIRLGLSGNIAPDTLIGLTPSIAARFNGTGSYINAIYDSSNPKSILPTMATWEFAGAITSIDFRLQVDRGASTQAAVFQINDVVRSASPGQAQIIAGGGIVVTRNAPQIAPGTSPFSLSTFAVSFGAPHQTYTTAAAGWWQADASAVGRSTLFRFDTSNNFYVGASSSGSGPYQLRWNGTNYPFNSFLQSVWTSPDPVFIMVTWSSTSLQVWTSVDNGGLYAQRHLAQQFTFSSALPAQPAFYPQLWSWGVRASDYLSGVNHYSNLNSVENFVAAMSRSGLVEGEQFVLPDAGTECSPLTVTFVGGLNPFISDGNGNSVGVIGDLGTTGVAVLDTSAGTLSVNGVVNNSLLEGDPFFVAAPGSTLNAFGGGDVTVCFRPAVISA